MRNYPDMKTMYKDIIKAQEVAQWVRDNTNRREPDGSLSVETLEEIGRTFVAPARSALRNYCTEKDPLRHSLREAPRYRHDDCMEEYTTEYGYLPEWTNGATDEEIRECIDDMWIYNNSPYDCSGNLFTLFIDYKRTPAGVWYIHKYGRDY